MSKPFCMNLWLVIPEKVRYNRKKDISKPVISGEFRCVSAEKKAGHAPGGNLRMTGFDCTKKKWGFLRMSTESKTRMTEGSISKKMILFAIPLFLGNLFQQLYNTAADCRKFSGKQRAGSGQLFGQSDLSDGWFY